MKLLHMGKVKEVYEVDEHRLLFKFTDKISVFDKIIPTLVPRKGEALARTSAFWFREVEKLGLRTHFLELPEPDQMLVKRMRIIQPEDLTPESVDFFVPLEVVARHYLAGSMHDRVKRGEVKPESLGLPAGEVPPYGARLPKPFVEYTTKFEPVDRVLSEEEARRLSGLTDEEFPRLAEAVLKVDAMVADHAEKRGLLHVDGKKEFGMDAERNLVLVDTFGTPDEDRWWDAAAHARGEHVEFSKEMVRQHYRQTGYHAQLEAARRAGEAEPPIPALPDEVTRRVTELYVDLYERLTGEAW